MEMVNEKTGESLVPKIPERQEMDGSDTIERIAGDIGKAVESAVKDTESGGMDMAKKVEHYFISTAPADLKAALLAMVERIEAIEAK
jgi:hypothetical protein